MNNLEKLITYADENRLWDEHIGRKAINDLKAEDLYSIKDRLFVVFTSPHNIIEIDEIGNVVQICGIYDIFNHMKKENERLQAEFVPVIEKMDRIELENAELKREIDSQLCTIAFLEDDVSFTDKRANDVVKENKIIARDKKIRDITLQYAYECDHGLSCRKCLVKCGGNPSIEVWLNAAEREVEDE